MKTTLKQFIREREEQALIHAIQQEGGLLNEEHNEESFWTEAQTAEELLKEIRSWQK